MLLDNFSCVPTKFPYTLQTNSIPFHLPPTLARQLDWKKLIILFSELYSSKFSINSWNLHRQNDVAIIWDTEEATSKGQRRFKMLLFPIRYKPFKSVYFGLHNHNHCFGLKKKRWEPSNSTIPLNSAEVSFPISTQTPKVGVHHGNYFKFWLLPTRPLLSTATTEDDKCRLDLASTYNGQGGYRQMKWRNVQLPWTHSNGAAKYLLL